MKGCPLIVWMIIAVTSTQLTSLGQESQALRAISLVYDFNRGAQGWKHGFAEYYLDSLESYQLRGGMDFEPRELVGTRQAYRIEGMNRSDDLFMYLTRRIGCEVGLVPNQRYEVRFEVTLASDAPSNGVGAGGSPGESNYLKIGATPIAPKPYLGTGPYRRFYFINVNKGNQSQSGTQMSVAGNTANGRSAELPPRFVSITRRHTHNRLISTSGTGHLWLIVGVDSGYEGFTRLYYQRIVVRLTPK